MTRTSVTLFLAGLFVAVPAGAASDDLEEPLGKAVFVGEPSVPTLTPAVRDLPDFIPDPNLFDLEAKRREDYGFIPVEYPIEPKIDPLFQPRQFLGPRSRDGFATPIRNFEGQSTMRSPPDTTGDVGPNHYVQAVNLSVSSVRVFDKNTGENLKTFSMQSLASSSPCNTGFCDPTILYDRMADRWIISELPATTGNICVYVSTTGDPTGTWNAYAFAIESSRTDFPKYGVWPQNGNGGSYLIGVNNGANGLRDLIALDRAKMLAGLPASFQKFSVPKLPNAGFQLVMPSTMQGNVPPPNGEFPVFLRPVDDEPQYSAGTPTDFLDVYALRVDWATPANSAVLSRPRIEIADYDMSLCGLGTIWNCMPQPGTTQKLDPIREPLHFPLQYRNFGDHQSLLGTFPVDADSTDHAALRWFELRKNLGATNWSLFQQGLVGGEAGVHRSVGSIGMDGLGNIALGYTRTGTTAPDYPSIYYTGRLATDPPNTMQGENVLQDGTVSRINNERWGDYAGMAIDPADDCTFWFTTEYMLSGSMAATRVGAFRFDACGCLAVPAAPTASATAPVGNRIDVGWNDSATSSIAQYTIYRSTTTNGPYVQVATVPDSSPGVGSGSPYVYHDDWVSGDARYFYVVKSTDGAYCVSAPSPEVSALATGACRLAPAFDGISTVSNPAAATCALEVTWLSAGSSCGGALSYSIYRDTTIGFTPSPANLIATGVTGESYHDASGLAPGTVYQYVVHAVDTATGAEDTNTSRASGLPTGPAGTATVVDTFEGSLSGGGFDRAGWTKTEITGGTSWAWSTAQKHDGTHAWLAAGVGSLSDKVLVSPPFLVNAGTALAFWHTYQFEFSSNTCWDGGTLEYTVNGGPWTVVPANSIFFGGYTGTVSATAGNSIGGKPAWCNGTIGPMTQVSVNLGGIAGLAGKTVQLRWHEGDDATTSSTGWYVDTVTIFNAEFGAPCATSPVCTPPGPPTMTDALGSCGGVSLNWSPGAGTTTRYNVFRSTTPGGNYTKMPGMPVAGTSHTDTLSIAGSPYYYIVTGTCDAVAVSESAASNEISATRLANGASCSDGNACTGLDTCSGGACVGAPITCDDANACTNDSCSTASGCVFTNIGAGTTSGLVFADTNDLLWSATPGAVSYDVVRGTLSALTGGGFVAATDACVASHTSGTSVVDGHLPAEGDADWFLIRSVGPCGAGSYDDGSASQSGSRNGGIAASSHDCP
jgi:hypothetical protein